MTSYQRTTQYVDASTVDEIFDYLCETGVPSNTTVFFGAGEKSVAAAHWNRDGSGTFVINAYKGRKGYSALCKSIEEEFNLLSITDDLGTHGGKIKGFRQHVVKV